MRYKILIPCPGLGIVKRGYETALSQCAETLRKSGMFDVLVLGGAASPEVDEVIPLFRRSWFPRASKIISSDRAYRFEQASFFFMAVKKALKFDPHVVYLSDELLTHYFYQKRERIGAKYRVLFRNGAPCLPPFSFCDHVQQINPSHYSNAVELGESPAKMTLLVPGFNFDNRNLYETNDDLQSLKDSLGLPKDRKILIAVGAIGNNFKRLDFIIEEVSKLKPRPFLVILGELDRDANHIKSLALRMLGESVLIRTVNPEEVSSYLIAADLFVHGALSEGFGRAIIEAAAKEKPCLLHDTQVYRSLLADYPYYADFTQPGNLAALIGTCLSSPIDIDRLNRQRKFVHERYSWNNINKQFHQLIQCQAEMAINTD